MSAYGRGGELGIWQFLSVGCAVHLVSLRGRFPLKKHLAGKKFDDDDGVQEEVMTWFKGQTEDFYDAGIQKQVPRLNKCLDNAGDCVEK
jgi:hypothetical protein